MPLHAELDRVSKVSVQDAIRRDIISGVLQPGTRVTEASLSKTHGVSRVPVREALHALEAEGFVESRANVGSSVAAIPVDDADDLFAVREALEVATARRAAARAAAHFSADAPPPDEWWRIRRILAAILDDGDAAVERDDLDPLVDLNNRFHLGIADLSGSPSLGVLLRQLSGKIEWLYASDMESRGKKLWPEHRVILSAIDAGDVDRAGELMRWHVRQSRIGYLSRSDDPTPSSEPEVNEAIARAVR
ncbi:GntR family transcriptional regulator [Marisediminicola senii]|uniref:GntR family transcriptional regulator n=1 Tax=Marisediminicola senii TaxID=2711233 RepID=UPI001F3A60ED|nr:GntR family transcriptional regulator [Marisediminicola senii]